MRFWWNKNLNKNQDPKLNELSLNSYEPSIELYLDRRDSLCRDRTIELSISQSCDSEDCFKKSVGEGCEPETFEQAKPSSEQFPYINDPDPDHICYKRATAFMINYEYGIFVDHSKTNKRELILYKRYMKIVRPIIWWLTIFNLCLSLFEWPSPFESINQNPVTAQYITSSVQICFLIVYIVDLVFERYFGLDKKVNGKIRNRAIIQFVLIFLTLVDIIISLSISNYKYRVSNLFRPWYLAYNNKILRIQLRLLVKVTIAVLDVLAVIFVVIFMFSTWIFFFVNDNYPDPLVTLLNLYTLTSTVNFPDVMIPAAKSSIYLSLFFVAFICVCNYFLFNYLLVSVANNYLKEFRKIASKEKIKNLDSAFDCLIAEVGHTSELSFIVWKRLFSNYLPKMREPQVAFLFKQTDTNHSNGIDRQQFRTMFEVMSRVEVFEVENPKYANTIQLLGEKLPNSLMRVISNSTNILVSLDTILFLITVYAPGLPLVFYEVWMPVLFFVLSVGFATDFILRIMTSGLKTYWNSFFHKFNVLTVFISLPILFYMIVRKPVVGGVEYKVLSGVLIVNSLRVFQLIFLINRFRAIARSLFNIASALGSFIVVLIVVFYEFAQIGLWLFADLISVDYINPVLDGTGYLAGEYQYTPFNNMPEAFLVLFELMVVNNWPVIAGGYVAVTTRFHIIYFILYETITVTICLNIVLSFFIRSILYEIQQNYTLTHPNQTVDELRQQLIEEQKRREELYLKLRQRQHEHDRHHHHHHHHHHRQGSNSEAEFKMKFKHPKLEQILESIDEQ